MRADGTPVLLDFGAARRAVAEMSLSLTGIVKAGYSPHEQYSSDGRLQGPWSDLYALGGTLYRAVCGKPPEEATLRFDEDHMATAEQGAKGKYRREFLAGIDTCLKVRHSERPRSVAQLRPMLLGPKAQPKGTERVAGTYKLPSERAPFGPKTGRGVARRWAAIAATLVVLGAGAYGGYEYRQWSVAQRTNGEAAADARQREIEIEEAKRRKGLADTAEAKRKSDAAAAEKRRIEEARRKDEEESRKAEEKRKAEADAEEKRREQTRIAALEEKRRKDEDERLRLAAIPNDDEQRSAFGYEPPVDNYCGAHLLDTIRNRGAVSVL